MMKYLILVIVLCCSITANAQTNDSTKIDSLQIIKELIELAKDCESDCDNTIDSLQLKINELNYISNQKSLSIERALLNIEKNTNEAVKNNDKSIAKIEKNQKIKNWLIATVSAAVGWIVGQNVP